MASLSLILSSVNHIKLRKYPTQQTPSSWSVYLLPWSLRARVAIKLAGNLATTVLQTAPCTCCRLPQCTAVLLVLAWPTQVLASTCLNLHFHTNLSVLVCKHRYMYLHTNPYMFFKFQFCNSHGACLCVLQVLVGREISISSVYTWCEVCCGRELGYGQDCGIVGSVQLATLQQKRVSGSRGLRNGWKRGVV